MPPTTPSFFFKIPVATVAVDARGEKEGKRGLEVAVCCHCFVVSANFYNSVIAEVPEEVSEWGGHRKVGAQT